jgi:hypothetical protein
VSLEKKSSTHQDSSLNHGITLLSARSKFSNQYNLPKEQKRIKYDCNVNVEERRTKKGDQARAYEDHKNS